MSDAICEKHCFIFTTYMAFREQYEVTLTTCSIKACIKISHLMIK